MHFRMFCVSALAALTFSLFSHAAVPGDLAVYKPSADVTINSEGQADSDIINVFNTVAVTPPAGVYVRDAGNDGVVLDAGKHLVIYSTRVDHVSGNERVEVNCYLTLDNGSETPLVYGRAQGYIRFATGADEMVVSGAAVVDAAGGDVLRLHTSRSDNNSDKTAKILANYTSIQLLRLDDGLDYLRVAKTNTVSASSNTSFEEVTYDRVDEASAGSMNFTAGSGDVSFNSAGYYLVLANTHYKFKNVGSDSRSGYTQRLTINGTPVVGSYTTTYIRTSPSGLDEQCDDGDTVIGRLIKVNPDDVLSVEQMKEAGSGCDIVGEKTGLTVVKLPSNGSYIMLEDTTNQDLNQAATTPVTFDTQAETPASVFSHSTSVNSSRVGVTQGGTYLFMSAYFDDQDSVDRQVPWNRWSLNGTTLAYGGCSRYSRNDQVFNNGNWSGVAVQMSSSDYVELTSQRLAAGGVINGESLALQGMDVSTLTSTNPIIYINKLFGVAQNSSRVISASFLYAYDSDSDPSNIVYTVTAVATNGVLQLNETAINVSESFTQQDINDGLVRIDSPTTIGLGFGFDFDISDGGAVSESGTLVYNVATPMILTGESGSTDEDTAITALSGSVTNLLDNDVGNLLVVSAYDEYSVSGASVVVNPDGTFSYDPKRAPQLQQLGAPDTTFVDTFTYTVTDAIEATAVATVSVTVAGIEDAYFAAPDVVVDSEITENAGKSVSINLVENDGIVRVDADGSDILPINYPSLPLQQDSRWICRGVQATETVNWRMESGVTHSAVSSSRAGINYAWSFDGGPKSYGHMGTSAGTDGIEEGAAGPNFSQKNGAIEVWVKPASIAASVTNTLFEHGGTTGSGIVIEGGFLKAASGIRAGEVVYDLTTDPMNLLGAGATAEFFQVVFVIDLTGDENRLYVNGTLVDTADNSSITDWFGGDGAGLGRFNGTAHGGFINQPVGTAFDSCYNGSIAILRLYSAGLTAPQVFQNFQAVDQGAVDLEGDAITVAGLVTNGVLVAGTGTPLTLASGATVELDSTTGDFTYDPTGIAGITGRFGGESLLDSFEYVATEANGIVSTGTVEVSVHGVSPAVADTVEVREMRVTTIAAGTLTANDQPLAGAPDPLVWLDCAAMSAQDIADVIWQNKGSAGAKYTFSPAYGVLDSVESGFGGVTRAWRNIAAAEDSFDPYTAGEADISIELCFKPAPGGSGRMVLFETGGNGNGFSIMYYADDNTVVASADCGADTDPNQQLRVIAEGVSLDEFNHVVVVVDINNHYNIDNMRVWLNNDPTAAFNATPFATQDNTISAANDWCGTDGTGIGLVSGTAALNINGTQFLGHLALLRAYTRALSVAEAEACFNNVARPVSQVLPATTALNATVAIDGAGNITYDATGLNTNIAMGATAQDSFTYSVSDGNGGTTSAVVTVTIIGQGEAYAVDDSFSLNDGDGSVVLDVLANDVNFGDSAVIVDPVVIADYQDDFYTNGFAIGDAAVFTNGWAYYWNAPTNFVSGGVFDGSSGEIGLTSNYDPLLWASNSTWQVNITEDHTDGEPGGYVNLHAAGGLPGAGYTQEQGVTNTLERSVIAAYTVAEAGRYLIADSFIRKASTAGDRLNLRVYVNQDLRFIKAVNPNKTTGFDLDLEELAAGDTIYVAVGSDATRTSDQFTWDFSIVRTPVAGVPLSDSLLGTLTNTGSNFVYDVGSAYVSLGVGQSVTETFWYTVVDGTSNSYAQATITVNGVNDAPVAVDNSISVAENGTGGVNVLDNDNDVDVGDKYAGFTVVEVNGGDNSVGTQFTTGKGALATLFSGGWLAYDPNGQFEGLAIGESDIETITYRMEDQYNATSGVATVTVTITGEDDGVIAVSNAYAVKEGQVLTGYLITDDSGYGVDSTIDLSDPLTMTALDDTGVLGVLTPGAYKIMGVRGQLINVTHVPQTVTFDATGTKFVNPVVFAGPPSRNENEVVSVVISNVNAAAGTFVIALKEQPEAGAAASDGDGDVHGPESLSWIVFEQGRYALPDGTKVEVGTVETAATREPGNQSWETVTFQTEFTNAPIVLNQIQSWNYPNELFGTRMSGAGYAVTSNSFDVALEDYEGSSELRTVAETIGWIAIEQATGTWNGVPFEAELSAKNVDEVAGTSTFKNTYSAVPTFIGSLATIAGVDPTVLRYTSLNTTSVTLLGQEDRYGEAEVGHAAENVTYLAIGGSGDLYAYHLDNGGFTFEPNGAYEPGYNETALETFTYTISDPTGNIDTETVRITIQNRYLNEGTLIILR